MNTINYNHCLRPRFTQHVFEQLSNDRSLNLFGPKGSGRSRLVEDLIQLAHSQGITTLKFNMEGFKYNYRGFIKDYEGQMVQQQQPAQNLLMQAKADAPMEELPSIALLTDRHQFPIPKQLILFLDDFDALLDNNKHQFPEAFFNDLNSFKNNANITLCCITTTSHIGKRIYYDGGRTNRTSWLELSPINIPRLTAKEIEKVLTRQLSENETWQNEPYKTQLIAKIYKHNQPLYFLKVIIESYQFDRAYRPYKKRFKRCHKDYKVRYPKPSRWKNLRWDLMLSVLLDILKKNK